MNDLMRFEYVSELLGLDARDEKRNRMLLSAVLEEINLFLDRNLLTGTRTDRQQTHLGEFYPEQYPVREFTEIVDDKTGTLLELTASFQSPWACCAGIVSNLITARLTTSSRTCFARTRRMVIPPV